MNNQKIKEQQHSLSLPLHMHSNLELIERIYFILYRSYTSVHNDFDLGQEEHLLPILHNKLDRYLKEKEMIDEVLELS
ncbi:unnamed protein product [Rotaria socialis]|nr:unnamed protein product [Rotaria socialis]